MSAISVTHLPTQGSASPEGEAEPCVEKWCYITL